MKYLISMCYLVELSHSCLVVAQNEETFAPIGAAIPLSRC